MKKSSLLLFVLASSTMVLSSCGNRTEAAESIVVSALNNATTIKVGETLQFSAKVEPENASQEVTWSVTKITGDASISASGLLTAVSKGIVEVVAASYTDSNVKGTYSLTIEENNSTVTPTSLEILGTSSEVKAGETLQLSYRVSPEGASDGVKWSTSDQSVATVNDQGLVTGVKEGSATITVTSTVDSSVKASKEITVTKGEATVDTSYEDLAVSTYAEYLAAQDSTKMKIEGTVVAISTKANKSGTKNAYVLNGNGGYYLYGYDSSFDLEVGKSYQFGGSKKVYKGMAELTDVAYFKALDNVISYSATDVSALDFDNSSEMYGKYDTSFIAINGGVTDEIEVSESSSYSFNVTLNGNSMYVYVDPTLVSADEFTKINAKLANVYKGYKVNIKGILDGSGYSNTYLTRLDLISADDVELLALTDEEKVNGALNYLMPEDFISLETTKFEVPTTVTGFDGVSVSWTFDETYFGTDGAITSRPEVTCDVTSTATLTSGEYSTTKSFVSTLEGKETYQTVHTLDFEDAEPADKNGNSTTKSGYDVANVELGTPTKAVWTLKNALIGGTNSDRKNGTFSARVQNNSDPDKSGKLTLCNDYELTALEFKAATYGGDDNGEGIEVSYSIDSGTTWKTLDRVFYVKSTELKTYKVRFPETSTTMRVAIGLKGLAGKRANIDDIVLKK